MSSSSVIPRSVRLAESPSHGLPVLLHDPEGAGSQAYSKLAAEIESQYVEVAQ